ncbi:hypothetical protein JCM8547_005546 [Rhodosporidiobolus lusitaniae]
MSSTSTQTLAEGGIPTSLPVLHLRGADDANETHQVEAPVLARDPVTGLRTDREYPEPYLGENPTGWPAGRGVPDYRPLNRNRDATTRPLGASTEQRVFVSLMMTGVWVIGRLHGAWAGTVGRVKGDLLVYPVGGQF